MTSLDSHVSGGIKGYPSCCRLLSLGSTERQVGMLLADGRAGGGGGEMLVQIVLIDVARQSLKGVQCLDYRYGTYSKLK